ncbi:MAG: hypothetical protein ACLQOO_07065, partial [Terriglobia bacterium]
PPRGGAVAGGYRSTLDTSGEDFHLSDQVRSQAHRFFAALRMTSLKVFGHPVMTLGLENRNSKTKVGNSKLEDQEAPA